MPAEVRAGEEWVRPDRFAAWRLSDLGRLRTVLSRAPKEVLSEDAPQPVPVEIAIPRPDGGFAFFAIVEAPVMAPELAAQFPEIRTFRGQGLDDPSSNIRLDLTPQGFHASVLGPNGSFYVDPYTRGDSVHYSSYYIQDLGKKPGDYRCYTEDPGNQSGQNPDGFDGGYGERASGTTLRTFQLAMAGTAEFTSFHGGTVALGQAAIVTGVNRMTQVWENECAIRFTLVANNSSLVYTNAITDPYTNTNVLTMLDENQANCDLVIGSANYDVGHVVGRANLGGVAQLGVVCSSGNKARGATALNSPTGDFFWVSYVCHEMGHQFNATHSFNSNTSPCIENRSTGTAYEPGGGTTIMSYAGICGADDILGQSNGYFHTKSYDQILAHATSRTCDTESATGNLVPTASAGADRTIPQGTAFEMTGTSSDGNGDPLTYCWEQIDLGVAQTLAAMVAADNGTSPIFRSYPASTSATRTFPRLTDVIDGSLSAGERYPGAARTMDLRFTVRDGRSGGGGVNADTVLLTVSTAAGPFQVTSPNTNVSWSGAQTVTWNVANTNLSPVSTPTVNILLSTDGGATFPTVLAAATANDGSQAITLPALTTSTARIKVKAVNNYYFDISNANFSITCPSIAAPTGLTATDGTLCDRVSLAWGSVAGAVDYEVFRGTGPVPAVSISIGTTASLSFDDTSAAAGSVFYYFIKARTACASSNYSTSDTGFTGGSATAPTGLSASDSTSCTEVFVSWTALSGATSYRVLRNTVNDSASGTLVNTTGGTTLSDTGGIAGVTYFYFVRAETASCGNSPYSAGNQGTRSATIAAPTGIAAGDGSSCTSITVSWTAAPGATSYSIWRSTVNDSATSAQIGTDTASPFSDTTALAGTGYFYWLKSINTCGAGAFSVGDAGNRAAAPSVPTGVSASDNTSCTQVDIAWSASPGATAYELYRNSINSTSGATLLTTIPGLAFTDATATEGSTFFYFVKSTNTCGASDFSIGDPGTRSVSPVAPASATSTRDNFCSDDSGTITLNATGGSGATLQWFAASCGGPSIGSGNGLVVPSPEATATYFARWESTCGQSACASVTVAVSSAATPPTLVTSNRDNFCPDDSGTITLNANGGSGETLQWFSASCGGPSIGSGNGLVIPSPEATTTYFVRWESTCGQSACASVTVTVSAAPEAPTLATSTRDNFCPDDSGTITLNATGGSGETLQWFIASCGGPSIGSGNALVIPSPDATTTYFGRWESTCGQSACASVTITVSSAATPPTLASVNRSGFCADDTGSISLSATGGNGDSLRWYLAGCGGESIGSGSPLVIDSPTVSSTYFASWEAPCGPSTCESVVVIVEPAPLIATVSLSGSSPYSQGASIDITVTLATAAGASGASIDITSPAFAPFILSVGPAALNGTASIVLANTGTSLTVQASSLSCSTGSAVSASFDVVGAASTLYVSTLGDDGNTGDNALSPLRNIQTAINRLVTGGVVFIADGIYTEQLSIDRSLTLGGSSAAGTVIDAGGTGRSALVSPGVVAELRDLTLRNGSAASGAGLLVDTGSTVILRRCEIIDCTATVQGGGIESFGSLTLIDSTLAFNTAPQGSAIQSHGSLSMTNSTITGNLGGGHAVLVDDGSAVIAFSTIAANSGSNIGVSGPASLNLSSSIIADAAAGSDLSGTVTSGGFNLIENPAGSSGLGATDQTGVDPLLASLANNGGPTRTMAPAISSPANDAGDPGCSLATDQRGNPRPVDGNGDTVAACDVGALEGDAPLCTWFVGGCPADFDGDGDFDSDDVTTFFADWDSGGGCADADLDGDTDSDDIAVFFTGWDSGGC